MTLPSQRWRARAGALLLAVALVASATLPVQSLRRGDRLEGAEADLHLLSRACFAVTPDDLSDLRRSGARGWLREQLHAPGKPEPALEARLALFPHYGATPRDLLITEYLNRFDVTAEGDREIDNCYAFDRLVDRQLLAAVESRYQLREQLADFFFNHFNVCWGRHDSLNWTLADYVEGVIRPHSLGRFRDLLGAVAHHPAMLVYLDNWLSSSASDGGLNENYARELLELHTVGADAGYTQVDVRQVARCFTGWTMRDRGVGDPREVEGSLEFRFDEAMHDARPHVIPFLGLTVPAGGAEQGEQVLDALARHPATARRLCRKLAVRFVDDQPPEALVDRAAGVWIRTDGDLSAVMECLLTSPEFYERRCRLSKLRTPFELVAGALRVLGAPAGPGMAGDDGASTPDEIPPTEALERLGAPIFQCLSPRGYPFRASDWDHPGGLLQRYRSMGALARRYAPGLAAREGLRTPAEMAARLLPGGVSPETSRVLRGEVYDPVAAAAEVLCSPEFQHR